MNAWPAESNAAPFERPGGQSMGRTERQVGIVEPCRRLIDWYRLEVFNKGRQHGLLSAHWAAGTGSRASNERRKSSVKSICGHGHDPDLRRLVGGATCPFMVGLNWGQGPTARALCRAVHHPYYPYQRPYIIETMHSYTSTM